MIYLILALCILFSSIIVSNMIIKDNYNSMIIFLVPIGTFILSYLGIEWVFYHFLLTSYSDYFVEVFKLPEFLTWHRQIFSISIIIILLNQILIRKQKLELPSRLKLILSLIFLSLIVSFFLNTFSIGKIVSAFQIYVFPIAIFVGVIVLPISDKFINRLIWAIIITSFLQGPISIIQLFLFERADFTGGLFSKHSAGVISILGLGFIYLGVYCYRFYSRKLIYLILSFLIFITLIISEGKFSLALLPFTLVPYLLVENRYSKFKGFLVSLFLIPVFYFFLLQFDDYHGQDYMTRTLVDPLYMIEMQNRDITELVDQGVIIFDNYHPTMGRLASVTHSYNLISSNTTEYLFGNGPAETSKNTFYIGSLAQIGIYRVFLAVLLLEFGVIGTFIWLYFLWYIFSTTYHIVSNHKNRELLSKIEWVFLNFSFIQLFVIIIASVYNQTIIHANIGIYFWICSAITLRIKMNKLDCA